MKSTRVRPFEYQVLKELKSLDINWANQRLLLACSGGRDSVVLLHMLARLQSRLKFELAVAHVNHGTSTDPKIRRYRTKAENFCRSQANLLGLKFHLIINSADELKSEAELRRFRIGELNRCKVENGYHWVVFAHHKDDLLETRLIRLARGTGAQGLEAMKVADAGKLRPLLNQELSKITAYAEQEKLEWLTDPTNSDVHYFRNWIRNSWLPLLEEKRKGSTAALARSLEQISERVAATSSKTKAVAKQLKKFDVIKRAEFSQMSPSEKRDALARIMLERGASDFSRRQIDEILKRLGSRKVTKHTKMSFETAGLLWRVNAEQIEVQKSSQKR